MKEYKFEVGAVYTDWVLKHNRIMIMKVTEKCVYFRVVASNIPVDTVKVYRGKKFPDVVLGLKREYYATEKVFFPKYLIKEIGYGCFSAAEGAEF